MVSAVARRFALTSLFLVLSLGSAVAAEDSPEEIFSSGNAAYAEERYAEARDAYLTVLKFDIEDPRVEYNLGNAEFRLGHLGPAILHFERARRLDPTDEEIRANLAHARSFAFDRVERPARPAVIESIVDLQDGFGPDRQAWIALALVWLLAGVVAWVLARPGRWHAAHGWVFAAIVVVLLVAFGSWYVTDARLQGQRLAVVLTESEDVLGSPGEGGLTLFTVHEGTTVEVRDIRRDWVLVSLPNSLSGWLSRDALGLV